MQLGQLQFLRQSVLVRFLLKHVAEAFVINYIFSNLKIVSYVQW